MAPTGVHSLPERRHITHMGVPWDGNQGYVRGFAIMVTENPFSIFVFCVKQV
jgi:hypothetical protein